MFAKSLMSYSVSYSESNFLAVSAGDKYDKLADNVEQSEIGSSPVTTIAMATNLKAPVA